MIVVCLLLFVVLPTRNFGQTSFDINDLDWSIRPVDNFFLFVNGRWINRTEIPPSQTSWGGIYTISYENWFKIKTILDELTNNGTDSPPQPVDSIQRQVADLYLAGLDEQAIEQAGIRPLQSVLIELQAVTTYEELIMFVLHLYKTMDEGVIFEFDVAADDRNSSVNMVNWKQTGIDLPERDYYFRNDPISKRIRREYVSYIDRILTLSNEILNLNTSLIDAEDILSLEMQLAVSHRTPSELRDPEKNYNKFTVVELDGMMPNLGWHRILSVLTIPNTTILMSQPDYYQLLDKLIVSQSLSIWKNKIRFSLVHQFAEYLNQPFYQARFHMFNHLIFGQQELKPRWMRIIIEIDQYLGELLGQLYVARYFSSHAKVRILDLVENILETFRQRILRTEWMSEETKLKSVGKLNAITKKIGYPSRWESYADVYIQRRSFFTSMISIFQHDYRKKMTDLRKPVDRQEWEMNPQTVNAYYHMSNNEIVFPAGMLQEPYFSFDADDALNYGGIGSIIGHELTHVLDDEGRQYDAQGNLRSWWLPADINAFNALAQHLVEQYNAYIILNTHVNGQLTLGENIADLGGLEIAYEAFLHTQQAQNGILVDGGFTPHQQFFFAYARAWRSKTTDEALLSFLKEDPHAPAITRINGPLSNMKAFYQIFNVTETDGMYRPPTQRILIW